MLRQKKSRGQSTVEYLVIFGVVLAAVIIVATTLIQGRVTDIYGRAANRINDPEVITTNMLPESWE